MARTFIRQESQIRNSTTYDDTLSSGSTLQSGAASIEGDLNSLRSQVKRVLGSSHWYDALFNRSLTQIDGDLATAEGNISTIEGEISTIDADISAIEAKKYLYRNQVLTDITVPTGQNWKILSVASSEAPSVVAAVNVGTNGAIVAHSALNGAGFNVHELIKVSGANAISPKNLAIVRDAITGQKIQSSSRDVFALVQYESTGADGGTFNDTSAGSRVKLSFVRLNSGLDDLEAVPVSDIENKAINYSYVTRINHDSLPEDSFISPESTFIDLNADIEITRQLAYNNQGTTPVELTTDADLDLAFGKAWTIRDGYDADLFQVMEGSIGSDSMVLIPSAVDIFESDAAANNFDKGVSIGTDGGNEVRIGLTDGLIQSSSSDLRILGFGELYVDDGNQTGSTWTQTDGIKLSDTTSEWDGFKTAFGEVSLLSAITTAFTSGSAQKTYANVTTTIGADTDVSLADSNLDTALPNMSSGTFTNDYDVFLNGDLLRPGANSGANNDYYPGSSATKLKFEFGLKTSDVICVVKKVA